MADSGRERPILFSGPMVQALLAGRKTQTRRAVKRQPDDKDQEIKFENGWLMYRRAGFGWASDQQCRYGVPGDRLWVREAFDPDWGDQVIYRADGGSAREAGYKSEPKWKPGIHMPRAASRINLEITGVRIERLQDISEDDARAEGVRSIGEQFENFTNDGPNKYTVDVGFHFNQPTAVACYAYLWDHINGAGAWEKNPWVWVVEFKRA